MKYKQQYFGNWQEPSLALLLWIKYDYETERYDLSLPHIMRARFAYPIRGAMKLSQINANDWRDWMNAMAEEYDISNEELHKAKLSNNNRGKSSEDCLKIYHEYKQYMPW